MALTGYTDNCCVMRPVRIVSCFLHPERFAYEYDYFLLP